LINGKYCSHIKLKKIFWNAKLTSEIWGVWYIRKKPSASQEFYSFLHQFSLVLIE